jgi:HEAT repeat protein
MNSDAEVMKLANKMASKTKYDEAWMLGLELQTFGADGIQAFCHVLEKGATLARRAAAFWLSDEAEMVPTDVFFKMATDEDSEIRFHAAYCLGYVKDSRTLKTLREMMHKDASEEVRQTATQSMYAAAKLNNILDGILDDFEKVLRLDQSSMVREEVVTSLANFLKSGDVKRAITLLEDALNDSSQAVCAQATISLSVLRNEVWDEAVVAHF